MGFGRRNNFKLRTYKNPLTELVSLGIESFLTRFIPKLDGIKTPPCPSRVVTLESYPDLKDYRIAKSTSTQLGFSKTDGPS
jgi:hypothetical protein